MNLQEAGMENFLKKDLEVSLSPASLALTGGEIRVKPLSHGASHKTPSAVPHLLPRGSLFLRLIVW